jgi:hypothetical protein
MNTNKGTKASGRIEALRERERQIRAAIVAETLKRKRRDFKDLERLKTIIGGALLTSAAEDPAFAGELKERLEAVELAESERNFLRLKRWL